MINSLSFRSAIAAGSLAIGYSAIANDDVFLFSYFLQENGGTYLAYSEDGRQFTTLNANTPIIYPGSTAISGWPSGQGLMRDPSLTYQNGTFHLVWTTNWTGTTFGYASSTNLTNWSTPQAISPYSSAQIAIENPKNIWAPEVMYDSIAQNYKIVWASTHLNTEAADSDNSNVGSWDNRQWFVTTTDFENFSQAKLYYDGSKDVLDGFTVFDDDQDRWIMAIKDNNSSAQGNNDRKIRLVINDDLNIEGDDWGPASGPIAGNGTSLNQGKDAEGPSLVKNGEEWLLYWDSYTGGDYGMASTTDIDDLNAWVDETNQFRLYQSDGITEINHPRHGTVTKASRSALIAFADEVPNVPEPSTTLLGALASCLLLQRRHPNINH